MSKRAVPHPQSEQSFVGTPRPLPRVLLCHVPTGHAGRWCGRQWTANTAQQYQEKIRLREGHHLLCANRAQL